MDGSSSYIHFISIYPSILCSLLSTVVTYNGETYIKVYKYHMCDYLLKHIIFSYLCKSTIFLFSSLHVSHLSTFSKLEHNFAFDDTTNYCSCTSLCLVIILVIYGVIFTYFSSFIFRFPGHGVLLFFGFI